MQASPIRQSGRFLQLRDRAGNGLSNSVTHTPIIQSNPRKGAQSHRSFICLATGGGDKPPSGGGPPSKPPSGPEDPSGADDHDPDDDEVVHLEEVQLCPD